MLEKSPSPDDMKETWVPRGIKAYTEHSYALGIRAQDMKNSWAHFGQAKYNAVFTELNNAARSVEGTEVAAVRGGGAGVEVVGGTPA